jgi:hypothetical protein
MGEEHSEIPSSDGYTYTPLVCDDGSIIPAQVPYQPSFSELSVVDQIWLFGMA